MVMIIHLSRKALGPSETWMHTITSCCLTTDHPKTVQHGPRENADLVTFNMPILIWMYNIYKPPTNSFCLLSTPRGIVSLLELNFMLATQIGMYTFPVPFWTAMFGVPRKLTQGSFSNLTIPTSTQNCASNDGPHLRPPLPITATSPNGTNLTRVASPLIWPYMHKTWQPIRPTHSWLQINAIQSHDDRNCVVLIRICGSVMLNWIFVRK